MRKEKMAAPCCWRETNGDGDSETSLSTTPSSLPGSPYLKALRGTGVERGTLSLHGLRSTFLYNRYFLEKVFVIPPLPGRPPYPNLYSSPLATLQFIITSHPLSRHPDH